MGKLARMKLQYFGHVTRGSAGNLSLTVLEGSIDGLQCTSPLKTQKTMEEWSGCSYIQQGDVTRQGAVEKKDNRVVICSRQTVMDDGRLVSE